MRASSGAIQHGLARLGPDPHNAGRTCWDIASIANAWTPLVASVYARWRFGRNRVSTRSSFIVRRSLVVRPLTRTYCIRGGGGSSCAIGEQTFGPLVRVSVCLSRRRSALPTQ